MAKSFARIHRDNLINNGIIPLVFLNEKDYDSIQPNDELIIEDAVKQVEKEKVIVKNLTQNTEYEMALVVTERQRKMLKLGGLLNMVVSQE